MFIVPGYSPITGHNPGLLPSSLPDITPCPDIATSRGQSAVRYVGGVGQRTKPELTFCVRVKHWGHSDMPAYLGSFSCTQRMLVVYV